MTLSGRKAILFVLDIVLFYLALIIALFLSFGKNLSWTIVRSHFIAFSLLYPAFALCLFIFDNYNLAKKHSFLILIRLATAIILFSTIAIASFYAFNSFGITPKTNLLIFAIILGIFLFAIRVLLFSLFSSHFQNKVLIFKRTKDSKELANNLNKNPQLGYKFIGFINKKDLPSLKKIILKKILTLLSLLKTYLLTPKQLSFFPV